MSSNKQTVTVAEAAIGQRLDTFISEFLQQQDAKPLTRAQVKKQIEQGSVQLNGEIITRPGQRLRLGEEVTFSMVFEASTLEHYDFPLEILHEDEDLLVINKPSGLSMHPGAGNKNKTLLNAILKFLQSDVKNFSSVDRPGIVHRLDKDTSGVLVVARTPFAQSELARQFAEKTTARSYRALAAVTPRARRVIQNENSGVISTQLGRDPHNRLRQAVVTEGGRKAVTHWQVLENYKYAVLLDLRLETGRTHQIRVHLASVGSPIYGDPLYGDFLMLPRPLQQEQEKLGRQLLHAYKLGFTHPVSKKQIEFTSAWPADFQSFYEMIKNYE